MAILSDESRALLKHMDAEDALEAAAKAGWNAAIEAAVKVCEETPVVTIGGFYDYDDGQRTLDNAAEAIRKLAGKE